MTDKNLEERLASAIEASTPDILADLMSELDIKDEPVMTPQGKTMTFPKTYQKAAAKRGMRKNVLAIAATLLVFAGVFSVYQSIATKTFATVGLDVNPSIELEINSKGKVISANAVNDEGEQILTDMDLKGSDINVADNAIVGAMLTKGYLTDTSNSILVSVRASDAEKGKELEKQISDNLNGFLENSEIAAAILGQYIEDDPDLEAYASANGISLGKAWLIQNLLDTGSTKMTEADLLNLSTQELILLGQKRNVPSETTYGDAESGKYIGHDKAISVALNEAGLSESQVSGLQYEFDCDQGTLVYEVEFRSGGTEYEYDIDAISGKIVSSEIDIDDDRYDSDDDDDDDDDD